MSNLLIYKASAGSGKTHTLTQEYLKLAFKDIQNGKKEERTDFTNILAVTFTNKAAEEMKERIVKELHNIAKKGAKSAHYQTVSVLCPNFDEVQIKDQAQKILDNILHNYSAFSVGTIDSFVQRVIRAFSYELGVQSGYRIEMDTEKVMDDLTKLLYDKIDTDKRLLRWLTKFAQFKIEAGKSWDFRTEVESFGREIFKERFQNYKAKNEDGKDTLSEFLTEIVAIRRNFENTMLDISKKSRQILKKHQIDGKNLGRDFGYVVSHLTNKIANKDYEPNKTVYKALEGADSIIAKSASSTVKNDILSVYPELSKCLEEAVNLYETDYSNYLTVKVILDNFHSFGILNDIAGLLPEYRETENLMLISDASVLLKKIIGNENNDAPFIYEKIGTRYHHILIDEFQDTSEFQWDNFRPLIVNSLADGNFNMIVGDIKQSIYRWRGGDWSLLLHKVEDDIGKQLIQSKSLDTNWRSRRNVIDFNNALFFNAPRMIQAALNGELNEITNETIKQDLLKKGYDKIITTSYSDSYQHIAPSGDREGGRTKIYFFEKDKEKKFQDHVNEHFPKEINELLQVYDPRDITILVRTNRQGKDVVKLLMDYMTENPSAKKYDIISGDSLMIENALSIRLLISALRYLYDQRNTLHLTALIHYYQLLTNSELQNHHIIFDSHQKELLFDFLPSEFVKNINPLKKMQLYELSEELISMFGLNLHKTEFPYIRTFQDCIVDFTRNSTAGIDDFLEWWDLESGKISIQLSDKQNAVKVMTIHKSKGLAFKVVVVPYCDWRLDHHALNQPIIWCEPKQAPFDTFSYLPIKYQKGLVQTIFQKDYFDEKIQTSMDALNTLYVAFTRPIEELIVMCPTGGDTVGDLMYRAIKDEMLGEYPENYVPLRQNFNDASLIYENGVGYKPKKELVRKSQNLIEIADYPNNKWREKLSVRSNSSDFFIKSVDDIKDRVNYGSFMHDILSKIITPDDIDDALQGLYFGGQVSTYQREELRKRVHTIVSREEVKDWFSTNWRVLTERGMLTTLGKIRIPDRVLFGKDKTVVIDFKFGKEREEYHEQVKEYMDLIQDMGYANLEGYLYYAESGKVVKI